MNFDTLQLSKTGIQLILAWFVFFDVPWNVTLNLIADTWFSGPDDFE